MFEDYEEVPEEIQIAVWNEIKLQTNVMYNLEEIIDDYEGGGDLFQFGKTSDIYGKTREERIFFWSRVLENRDYDLFFELIRKESATEIVQDGNIFMI